MIDYPLSLDVSFYSGIEYMEKYLETLYWENEFCRHFDASLLQNLLTGYDENADDLLINVFELAFGNALALTMVQEDPRSLAVTPARQSAFRTRFSKLSKEELLDETLRARTN
jgi:hypothetical protein